MDLRATREATKARVRRRTSLTTAGGRERELLETPLGQRLAGPLFTPLVDFFSGKQSVKSYPAPEWLAEDIKNIRPEVLALATLAPVLHAWYRGGLHKKSPLRDLKQKSEKNWTITCALTGIMKNASAPAIGYLMPPY
jgi:hypothetical protein